LFEFKLPDLGEGVHEGEVLKWHVKAGDHLAEDDPLVDVETDKAAVTIPSPKAGKVVSVAGKIGDTLLVGEVIAVIDVGDGAASERPAPAAAGPKPAAPKAAPAVAKAAPPAGKAAAPKSAPTGPSLPGARGEAAAGRTPGSPRQTGRVIPAAPATRRLARERGIDLREVAPSGPGGRVVPADLDAFATGGRSASDASERPQRTAADFAAGAAGIPFLDIEPMPDFEHWGPVVREPLRSIRRKVARKMTTSMILVPHVAHMDDADVSELEAYREREKPRLAASGGQPPTLLAFVVKAVTAGLVQTPSFNASLDPFREEIVFKQYYNIGIAVDTGRGLVVPVIRDTDRKSIVAISSAIEDLAKRAREGTIEVSELQGGTFTITNVGPIGGTALIPAVNYPEVAILGMGRVQEKPVVRNGQIVIRKMLPLTLSFDHRVADGADAARFVSEMVRELSDPNLLLLET